VLQLLWHGGIGSRDNKRSDETVKPLSHVQHDNSTSVISVKYTDMRNYDCVTIKHKIAHHNGMRGL